MGGDSNHRTYQNQEGLAGPWGMAHHPPGMFPAVASPLGREDTRAE